MSKDDSVLIKGVAILMMVFYHLFCCESLVNQLECLIPIGIYERLSECCNPVNLYLMLSGYGLFVVNEKGDTHRYIRVWRLLQHYWVITILFVILGCYIKPSAYPGSLAIIFENATAYKCTYNTECWFLFPFILLSICAGFIIKFINRLKWWMSFTSSFTSVQRKSLNG